MKRISKETYYLNIANAVSLRSTCNRRRYGAVIVKNDEIISTGYNGSPRGHRNCNENGICERERLNIPSGERYELCSSVHAEQNAIISAPRDKMIGSTLYLFGFDIKENKVINAVPCAICEKLIKNSGITKVISSEEVKLKSQITLDENKIENIIRKPIKLGEPKKCFSCVKVTKIDHPKPLSIESINKSIIEKRLFKGLDADYDINIPEFKKEKPNLDDTFKRTFFENIKTLAKLLDDILDEAMKSPISEMDLEKHTNTILSITNKMYHNLLYYNNKTSKDTRTNKENGTFRLITPSGKEGMIISKDKLEKDLRDSITKNAGVARFMDDVLKSAQADLCRITGLDNITIETLPPLIKTNQAITNNFFDQLSEKIRQSNQLKQKNK